MKKNIILLLIFTFIFIGCGEVETIKNELGGSFELKEAVFTANYLIDGWVHPSNPFDGADEGRKAVVLNLTVKNNADEEFSELSTNFSLKYDGDQIEEATNYVGITDDSGLSTCGPTISATPDVEIICDLVFEVNEDADVLDPSLVYEPLFGDEGAQTFKLK